MRTFLRARAVSHIALDGFEKQSRDIKHIGRLWRRARRLFGGQPVVNMIRTAGCYRIVAIAPGAVERAQQSRPLLIFQ
jgi:hypothetical protein